VERGVKANNEEFHRQRKVGESEIESAHNLSMHGGARHFMQGCFMLTDRASTSSRTAYLLAPGAN
jgi:hypothetical protein